MKKTIVIAIVLALCLTSMSPAAEDTWTYKADMPTARGFTSGCVADGEIYVVGGFPTHYSVTSANEMYDPATDTWTRMANMPSARCGHATCALDGKIYVFGGTSPDGYSSARKNVYVYDPQTDSWTLKADMPYANAFCGIAVVNDTIYLIGGTTKLFSPPIPTVIAYDPVTETWTQKADMPTARYSLSACVVDGKIYTFGGTDQNIRTYAYKTVEVYDPATNTWTAKNDMSTGLFGLGTCDMNGKIYAVGGVTNGLRVVATNKLYDPVTDTWAAKSPLQDRRQTYVLDSVGDKIYAIGGSYPDPQNPSEPVMITSVEEYDTGLGIPSPDFNGDGIVDATDMCIMVDHWGEDYPPCDIGPQPFGDGIIDVQDLIVLAEHLFEGAGLVAHWALDETAGDIAYDSAGNIDATVYNGQWSEGKIDGALDFNGLTTYMDCGDSLRFGTRKMTLAMWLEPQHMGGMRYVLSRARDVSDDIDYVLMRHLDGKVEFAVAQAGSDPVYIMSEATTPLNEWTHVAVSLDGSQATIYINGRQDASAGYVQRVPREGFRLLISSLSSSTRYYNGKIDDMRIYNVALTAEQIEELVQ